MSVEVPRTIRLGGVRYRASVISEMPEVPEGNPCLGTTHCDTARIVLWRNPCDDVLRKTLLHECLHAIMAESGYAHNKWSEAEEEQVVQMLTPWLLTLLRQNPALVKALTG